MYALTRIYTRVYIKREKEIDRGREVGRERAEMEGRLYPSGKGRAVSIVRQRNSICVAENELAMRSKCAAIGSNRMESDRMGSGSVGIEWNRRGGGVWSDRVGEGRRVGARSAVARSFSRRDVIECPSRTIGTSMERDKRIGLEYRVSDAAPIGITEERQRARGREKSASPLFAPQGLES